MKRQNRRARQREVIRNEKAANTISIIWLRDDMRFHDNPALYYARDTQIIPVFIHVLENSDSGPDSSITSAPSHKKWDHDYPLRGCGLWYKHESLKTFENELRRQYDTRLLYRIGENAESALIDIIDTVLTANQSQSQNTNQSQIQVLFNERYEPWFLEQDEKVVQALRKNYQNQNLKFEIKVLPGNLLVPPWDADPERTPYGFGSVSWYRHGINLFFQDTAWLRKCQQDRVEGGQALLDAYQDAVSNDKNVSNAGNKNLFETQNQTKNQIQNSSSNKFTQESDKKGQQLASQSKTGTAVQVSASQSTDYNQNQQQQQQNQKKSQRKRNYLDFPIAMPCETVTYLTPYPGCQYSISSEISKSDSSESQSYSKLWSLDLSDLGYNKTTGRGFPKKESIHNIPNAISSWQTGVIDKDAEFKQYNPYRKLNNDPNANDWAYQMKKRWKIGEQAALERLDIFLDTVVTAGLFECRDRFRADREYTAILSPYVRFGELSVKYIYQHTMERITGYVWDNEKERYSDLKATFIRRFLWRDLAYWSLYRFPNAPDISLRIQYEKQPWSGTKKALRRWQVGRTGFPLVDAAMRCLWKEGWINNYLRHVCAQFLMEYLDCSWKDGFKWFDYTLIDTDVSINAHMWQNGSGCGLDPWNFVMHPIFAAKRCDPDGDFTRKWLPELKKLPREYIHCPWEAPLKFFLVVERKAMSSMMGLSTLNSNEGAIIPQSQQSSQGAKLTFKAGANRTNNFSPPTRSNNIIEVTQTPNTNSISEGPDSKKRKLRFRKKKEEGQDTDETSIIQDGNSISASRSSSSKKTQQRVQDQQQYSLPVGALKSLTAAETQAVNQELALLPGAQHITEVFYPQRILIDLNEARMVHTENVLGIRNANENKHRLSKRGNEFLDLPQHPSIDSWYAFIYTNPQRDAVVRFQRLYALAERAETEISSTANSTDINNLNDYDSDIQNVDSDFPALLLDENMDKVAEGLGDNDEDDENTVTVETAKDIIIQEFSDNGAYNADFSQIIAAQKKAEAEKNLSNSNTGTVTVSTLSNLRNLDQDALLELQFNTNAGDRFESLKSTKIKNKLNIISDDNDNISTTGSVSSQKKPKFSIFDQLSQTISEQERIQFAENAYPSRVQLITRQHFKVDIGLSDANHDPKASNISPLDAATALDRAQAGLSAVSGSINPKNFAYFQTPDEARNAKKRNLGGPASTLRHEAMILQVDKENRERGTKSKKKRDVAEVL